MILSERERKILRLRFAIDKPEKVQYTAKETLQNVGYELGISHNRVKILEERALKKLNIQMSDVLYNRNDVLKVIEKL